MADADAAAAAANSVAHLLWRADVYRPVFPRVPPGEPAGGGVPRPPYRLISAVTRLPIRRTEPFGRDDHRDPDVEGLQAAVNERLRAYGMNLYDAVMRAVHEVAPRETIAPHVLFRLAEQRAFWGPAARVAPGVADMLNRPPPAPPGEGGYVDAPLPAELRGYVGARLRGRKRVELEGVSVRTVQRSFNRAMVAGMVWHGMPARNRASRYWASFSQRGFWSTRALVHARALLTPAVPGSWASRFPAERDALVADARAYVLQLRRQQQ